MPVEGWGGPPFSPFRGGGGGGGPVSLVSPFAGAEDSSKAIPQGGMHGGGAVLWAPSGGGPRTPRRPIPIVPRPPVGPSGRPRSVFWSGFQCPCLVCTFQAGLPRGPLDHSSFGFPSRRSCRSFPGAFPGRLPRVFFKSLRILDQVSAPRVVPWGPRWPPGESRLTWPIQEVWLATIYTPRRDLAQAPAVTIQ